MANLPENHVVRDYRTTVKTHGFAPSPAPPRSFLPKSGVAGLNNPGRHVVQDSALIGNV